MELEDARRDDVDELDEIDITVDNTTDKKGLIYPSLTSLVRKPVATRQSTCSSHPCSAMNQGHWSMRDPLSPIMRSHRMETCT
jgi:hypothetical protein